MPSWITDFRELWIIVGVAAVIEAIAIWQGKQKYRPTVVVYTISSRMWLAIQRYPHFTPLFFSACLVLAVHFWFVPTVPQTWTSPEGWAYIIVGVVVVWAIHLRRRAMDQGIGIVQKIREEPLYVKFAAGTGLVPIVVILLRQFAGVEVDEATLAAVFVFIGTLVTAWQRRSVTATAKIERLEDRGLIQTQASNPQTVMEVIKDPPAKAA